MSSLIFSRISVFICLMVFSPWFRTETSNAIWNPPICAASSAYPSLHISGEDDNLYGSSLRLCITIRSLRAQCAVLTLYAQTIETSFRLVRRCIMSSIQKEQSLELSVCIFLNFTFMKNRWTQIVKRELANEKRSCFFPSPTTTGPCLFYGDRLFVVRTF